MGSVRTVRTCASQVTYGPYTTTVATETRAYTLGFLYSQLRDFTFYDQFMGFEYLAEVWPLLP